MASPEHSWSVDPLSLEVRHESGKFVVSHPALNIFVEAETLDKAYRQITELIENHPHNANRQDMRWNWALTEFYSLARSLRTWLGQHNLMWSLIVLASKTTVVVIVGATVIALMGITMFSLFKPQITATIKNYIGPAALARKVSSIDPVDQALYQENLQVIVNFLLPFANSIRPLVAAATSAPSQETRPESSAPIDLAQPPKSRPGPD